MDGIYGLTPASGIVDCVMPPPATNVPQGSPDLPREEKEQSANSTKSHVRDMEKKVGVSELLEEQIIVGLGAVNLTHKAEENKQEASKVLVHNQVKPEDESSRKPDALPMIKKDIGDTDNLWPDQIGVKWTSAELKQRVQEGFRDFPKWESARKKYLKERQDAARKLIPRRKSQGV